MDLKPWKVTFKAGWDRHFPKFDKATQQRILKKLEQMKQPLQARGLHASRYQVEEAGQHRIAFILYEETRVKDVYFIGNHKQYLEWLAVQ